jgi:hypothetical protein
VKMSLTKEAMRSERPGSPRVTAFVARRLSSWVRSMREKRYSSMVMWKASRSLRLTGTGMC